MKNTIEITLSSIHIGSSREVVTLAYNGKDYADKFLNTLKKKDPIAYKSIKTRIKAIAEYLEAKELPSTILNYEEPEE